VNCELSFITKLYKKSHISRKDIDEIIADTKELCDELLEGTAVERTSFENLST
jgi:nucleoid DNA-binding protein